MEMITVKHGRHLTQAILLLLALAGCAAAGTTMPAFVAELEEVNIGLTTVASALGVLVITYAGIKWIMADNPQERDDAKKTIIYVIVGLLVVSMARDLVAALYNPATTLPTTTLP